MTAAQQVPKLRPAAPTDAPEILALIRELADYEHLLHEVDATREGLHAALFGPSPRVFCDLAEQDGGIAGFALWFYSFSTFRGRHGIYLEDLFVRPAMRGRGIGRALLSGLASRCLRDDLARLEWSVLDWNEPALAFYRTLGARGMKDWIPHRVTGEALLTLARGDPKTLG
ncbi:MAG: GNAT family N-acetyltransferase [Proteobacteria bacterium]|nr:GNAT family N-acetyltransferase [Pseudomonadota bacterium]